MLGVYYKKMKLLLNHDEIAGHLARQILLDKYKKTKPPEIELEKTVEVKFQKQKRKGQSDSVINKIQPLVGSALQSWMNSIAAEFKEEYKFLSKNINLDNYSVEEQISAVEQNHYPSFVKTIGPQLSSNTELITHQQLSAGVDNILIRNIINNESLLQDRIVNNQEFWFIDTGYTNFLIGKKHWHRLVHNHIHHVPGRMNADKQRLDTLTSLPQPWRTNGHGILVIEASEQHYRLFGTTLEKWRDQVVRKLRRHTDRPIEFRPKENKKIRTNLYEHLLESDYYCVVHHSSAAGIEAVWAGIPIITLGQHISSRVARTSLSKINDLYRGPTADWLCELTYSQYTLDEFYNGTAIECLKRVGYV